MKELLANAADCWLTEVLGLRAGAVAPGIGQPLVNMGLPIGLLGPRPRRSPALMKNRPAERDKPQGCVSAARRRARAVKMR